VIRDALAQPLEFLGEGYYVIALAEAARRFVVKYAKHPGAVPPLAAPDPGATASWARDHGVTAEGLLHPAVWQHLRAFETYGELFVPCRVYLAERARERLVPRQQRALARFERIVIVRSLEAGGGRLRIRYPDGFAREKRAPDAGLEVEALIVQGCVTPCQRPSRARFAAGMPPAPGRSNSATRSSPGSCGAAASHTSTSRS
jgi:hypothetical protein